MDPGVPIAVVGMSCRVAGAEGLGALWRMQTAGVRAVRPVPDGRLLDLDTGFLSIDTPQAALIDGVDEFDAAFFAISRRMASWMDPQQRMLLELAWHGLESAAIDVDALRGHPVAVFASTCVSDYRERMNAARAVDSCTVPGTLATFAANRISYQFDWTGPSFAVDSACSSGLTAVGVAIQGLRAGAFPLAVVLGSNVICHGFHTSGVYRAGALSPTGRSVPFSARRDGYVRGEGGVCLVLKPLPDALRDGDPLHTVILDVGLGHDGRAGGLTGSDAGSQARLIERTLASCGLPAASIGYFEAHGTGTGGDAAELAAIVEALPNGSRHRAGPEGTLWVGSVKARTGHLEAAAGLLGIVNAALVMRHGAIPPVIGRDDLDPAFRSLPGGVAVADREVVWARGAAPCRAAVNSFGMGGALGHAVLEEPVRQASPSRPLPAPAPLPVSAATPEALRALAGRLAAATPASMTAPSLAWTLQGGRATLAHRRVVVGRTIEEARAGLVAVATDQRDERVATTHDRAALLQLADRDAANRWLDGDAADWLALWPQGPPPRLDLEVPYPFERRSYWFEPDAPARDANTGRKTWPIPR